MVLKISECKNNTYSNNNKYYIYIYIYIYIDIHMLYPNPHCKNFQNAFDVH